MGLKESNEITVKIKCELEEFYRIIESKGFNIIDRFSMKDYYFVPTNLILKNMSTREILSNALLVRDIYNQMTNKAIKKITYKIKEFDGEGNILNQEAINCDIFEIEDAKRLLSAIGYNQIMIIKENDIVYEKDKFQLAIKDIENGDNLIEIETIEGNSEFNTIEKLKSQVEKLHIPVEKDNYFVKKAEIELNKVLKRI